MKYEIGDKVTYLFMGSLLRTVIVTRRRDVNSTTPSFEGMGGNENGCDEATEYWGNDDQIVSVEKKGGAA